MSKTLTKSETFFYDNAGFSYDPRTETEDQGKIRCAKSLAEAEQDAELVGIEFEWNYDDNADYSWMDEEEKQKDHCVEYCLAKNPLTKETTALCGIFDADANYRRVVEAELASEII